RGERTGTGVRFLGIPYARPPIGPLRFAAPVPPEPWAEVLDARVYGPTAQRRPFAETTTIPEPCVPGESTLNLNVFTPVGAAGQAGLPVLVRIHGGGFVAGCSASPWYDGTAFNRDGVVLVPLGYRLGIEGFLHLEDSPDNRGVLDWIAALRWVRENIAAFGGDPDKVTVAGQSAGGGAVQTLLATPAAAGLFRAAISASGAVMRPQGPEFAATVSEFFTARTGVPATAAALRGLTDEEILALQDELHAPGSDRDALPMLVLAPFADGALIPEPVPDALIVGAAGQDIPLMTGCTAHEFNAVAEGETGRTLTDEIFRAPVLALAESRASRDLPTWIYQFDWTVIAPAFEGLARHCIDLPFAFDLLGAEGVDKALGEAPPSTSPTPCTRPGSPSSATSTPALTGPPLLHGAARDTHLEHRVPHGARPAPLRTEDLAGYGDLTTVAAPRRRRPGVSSSKTAGPRRRRGGGRAPEADRPPAGESVLGAEQR
ncbi:carboxylesterase/lipase family protein, partial [Streptomyces sp. NPDC088178]